VNGARVSTKPGSTPPVIPGYTYIRPLGSGGFATVFQYEQDMPRRVVAVKVLKSDAINASVLQTFNAEADVMARLSAHSSIVTIYQASIAADGRPYFVMEFCPDTMSARYKKAPLGVDEVLDAGVRVAGALETAHRTGVLHRDIKPSNILINSLRNPALADFGIAAAIPDGHDDDERVFAMSVPWSSPEVIQEKVTGSVPSEIWSLGATLYTLLAGRSPFDLPEREKNTRELVSARIVKAHYVPINRPDVPPALEGVLAKSMHKDPSQRQESMFAFAEELRWVQGQLGLPMTTLEVAAREWASASAPVNFSDAVSRGPIITTVNKDSRRAARARKEALSLGEDKDGLTVRAAPSPLRAGLIGAGVAVGVVVVALVALVALGVI
jgi:eukaryotic-like serine/threonine-protein kinase